MKVLRYIHWNPEEADVRAARIAADGYQVDWRPVLGSGFLRELTESPPDGVVIDLSRLPSQGRDLGIQIRKRKSTRSLPLLFLGGDPVKVNAIKDLLPDAVYAPWENLKQAIVIATEQILDAPIVPDSVFAGYAGKPLAEKLGLQENALVALVGAPEGFVAQLNPLPDGIQFLENFAPQCDLTLWFVLSMDDLNTGLGTLQRVSLQGPIWIAWPKKASGVESDLTQQGIRRLAMASGFVDYKICSMDSTWSGLLFKQRSIHEARE